MMVTKTIEEVCEIVTGGTPPKTELSFFQGNIPWIKPSCLDCECIIYDSNEHLSEEGTKFSRKVPVGSILVSCIGIIGKLAIAGKTLATNQQINSLVIKNQNEIDSLYLFFLLQKYRSILAENASLALVPILNKTKLGKIRITFEDRIDEQRAIVATLKSKLEAIASIEEKTKKQMAELEAWSEAINWETISFDAKPQELRKFCKEDKHIIQQDTSKFENLKYLGMENIEKGTWRYVPSSDAAMAGNSTTYYFDNRHLLYGKLRPYLKKVFLPVEKGRCSTELIPFLPDSSIEREYLALIMTSGAVVKTVMDESTGSRMPRANIRKLLSWKVAVPDIEIQRERLAKRRSKIQAALVIGKKLNQQLVNLSALRNALYREAFGGDGE